MTIEVGGKAPNLNGHIVSLVLHFWGLPQIIEMIHRLLVNKKTWPKHKVMFGSSFFIL
jgi:hypothetical protein